MTTACCDRPSPIIPPIHLYNTLNIRWLPFQSTTKLFYFSFFDLNGFQDRIDLILNIIFNSILELLIVVFEFVNIFLFENCYLWIQNVENRISRALWWYIHTQLIKRICKGPVLFYVLPVNLFAISIVKYTSRVTGILAIYKRIAFFL